MVSRCGSVCWTKFSYGLILVQAIEERSWTRNGWGWEGAEHLKDYTFSGGVGGGVR